MARTAGAGRALKVTGLAEVDRALKSLPAAVQKKVIRQAIRKALKPVRSAVKSDAPVDTGLLKSAVKVKSGPRRKNSITALVTIGEGDFKGETFYASMQEYGYHLRGVLYPGTHFMQRAFEATKGAAARQTMDEVRDGIEREAAALGKS